MVNELSQALNEVCTRDRSTVFFFTDNDVVLPYLWPDVGKLGGCNYARETVVTPFTKDAWAACQVVGVAEFHPGLLPYVGLGAFQDGGPSQWREFWTWSSVDGRYGFKLYHHFCVKDGGANG